MYNSGISEFILMQRKPGGYRKPTEEQRRLSMIDKKDYDAWFRQIWSLGGASTKEHPAPFPLELASRLVRMFSFWGDTVLDPFSGTGTTMLAAMKWGRNSIGVEVDRDYCRIAARRLKQEAGGLFSEAILRFERLVDDPVNGPQVREDEACYKAAHRPTK